MLRREFRTSPDDDVIGRLRSASPSRTLSTSTWRRPCCFLRLESLHILTCFWFDNTVGVGCRVKLEKPQLSHRRFFNLARDRLPIGDDSLSTWWELRKLNRGGAGIRRILMSGDICRASLVCGRH